MGQTTDPEVKRAAKAFGTVLRRYRDALRLSQERMAEAVGLDRTYVSMLERGVHQPSLAVFVRVARALGVPADRFMAEVMAEMDRGV